MKELIMDTLFIALARCVIEADFKTVKVKFLQKGAKEDEIKKYFQDFKALKKANRIKKKEEKDISYWGKQPFKEFTKFINGLKETKSKTAEKKLQKMEGAELKGENDLWSVYKITTHKASCFYGSGTKWCTTEKDSKHWDDYQKENDFYYFLSKITDEKDPLYKIAMNVNTEGEKQYWDAKDRQIQLPSDLENSLPKFKIDEVEEKIEIEGKVYTLEEFYKAKNLKVSGDLYLSGTKITTLPEGLKVGGDLHLSGTPITTLPEGLEVGGDLDLSGSKITTLPEGLKVGGDLDLRRTPITTLPEGLEVGGGLDLRGTPITTLPEGLEVGGGLYLSGSKITTLPEGLKVGGYLDLRRTPITTLPEGLEVGGGLYLFDTKITSLPEGLKVGGDLDLSGSKITSLPEDLKVGGDIYTDKTDIKKEEVPKHLQSKIVT